LFNLFTINDRIIDNFDGGDPNNIGEAADEVGGGPDYGDNDISGVNNEGIENNAQTFMKVDADYEKKFGRLYKTFDVRYLKGKIWESIDKVKLLANL
jgi:hypothetical protein